MEKFYNDDLKFTRIIKTSEPTKDQLEQACKELKEELKKADKNEDESVLLSVYASCHGVLQNTTFIVLNEKDEQGKFVYFPLEDRLELLSKNHKNTFITGIFDCCREVVKEEVKTKGKN